jgi:hypothetical protein
LILNAEVDSVRKKGLLAFGWESCSEVVQVKWDVKEGRGIKQRFGAFKNSRFG